MDFGYFWKKLCHQVPSNIAQSGHTDQLDTCFKYFLYKNACLILMVTYLRSSETEETDSNKDRQSRGTDYYKTTSMANLEPSS